MRVKNFRERCFLNGCFLVYLANYIKLNYINKKKKRKLYKTSKNSCFLAYLFDFYKTYVKGCFL